ncbi:hypothetical protein [Streptomyces sp. NPDC096013]|uniref:hypothetical protein n=1 Tax=Streptomyces sp. NPDC096013 TaxID=3366069 RepID=UPI0038182E6E
MIGRLGVRVEFRERFTQSGDGGDLPGDVSVESVAVAGPSERPRAGGRVVETAESI